MSAVGVREAERVVIGPSIVAEAGAVRAGPPLAVRLVRHLCAHGDRVLQVVVGQPSSARWVVERAAAELAALQTLTDLGVGQTVVVCCGRSHHFAPALVAVLCSGAVCAIVNPGLTTDNLRAVLQQIGPSAVLCDQQSAAPVMLVTGDHPVLVLGEAEAVTEASHLLLATAQMQGGDDKAPALALLTSGTTGRPKVIRITAGHICLLLQMLSRKDAPFGAGDTLMFTTDFFWISGVMYTLWSIDSGMKVVLTQQFDPVRVLEAIEEFKPNALFMPPNHWVSLTRHVPETRLRSAFSCVRLCVTGGAAMGADSHARIQQRVGRLLRQWYGQTEGFPLTGFLCGDWLAPPPGSTGRISPGLQGKVLDLATGKCLVPVLDGELVFRGPIIVQEFVNEDGWLNTGDVGHFDVDGNFYVVDRIKELVKYKGHHLSPSELEAVLQGHPQVLEAVVVGIPHDEDQEHPAAYVVLAPGATVTPAELQQFAEDKTGGSEEKKLRGGVFPVASIPRLPTGKVSRGQLRRVLQEQLQL